MELNLKGEVAVVTGGGSGIGEATALEFAREGVKVAICGRNAERLEAARQRAAGQGYSLYTRTVDVSDKEAVSRFAADVSAEFGGIDIWVNNAAILNSKPYYEYTEADIRQMLDINFSSVFHCTCVAVPYLKQRHGGVILNASSFATVMPHGDGVLYAATKSAVSSLTRSFAANLAPHNIRVISYVPGMIVTELTQAAVALHEQEFTANIALKRLGEPADIAKPLVFLASDAASYITGVEIRIDGGKFAVQNPSDCWTNAAL